MTLEKIAQENLGTRFVDNPCRGIVLGKTPSGKNVQLSWIMGRSENSQNRIYKKDDDGRVWTEAADPSKVKDPSLIIYNAMHSAKGFHIVSNGAQTDSVYNGFLSHQIPHPARFFELLQAHYCEPDDPVLTPRITGYSGPGGDAAVSVLKADPTTRELWGELKKEYLEPHCIDRIHKYAHYESLQRGLAEGRFPTQKNSYELNLAHGFGYCVTTYKQGTSTTLESFEGEPFLVPIKEDLEESMYSIWDKLEEKWKVAMAAKEFNNGTTRIELINTRTKI